MRLVYGFVLVLAVLVLAAIQGVESECQDWKTERDSKNVCCKKCKPGNRLISDCGPDQNALCGPCGNDTYILDTSQKNCLRCTQCIGVMRVKEKCSSSSDTVCECSQGFRCGDEQCSFCVLECVKGQQPTKDRKCQPCPPGMFNDKIHRSCKNWSRCTQPGHEIIRLGTAESDIKCGLKKEPNQTTSPPDYKPQVSPPGNTEGKVMAILITFGLLCIVIPTFTILYLERMKIKVTDKPKDALTAEETRGGPEECSFCFPQQEHGGSSQTSMSSLASEEKILPLHV